MTARRPAAYCSGAAAWSGRCMNALYSAPLLAHTSAGLLVKAGPFCSIWLHLCAATGCLPPPHLARQSSCASLEPGHKGLRSFRGGAEGCETELMNALSLLVVLV